jgi:hypothetical protein
MISARILVTMRRALLALIAACSGHGGSHATNTAPTPPPVAVDAGVADVGLSPAEIHAVTDPKQIKGAARVDPQGFARGNGPVKSLAGSAVEGDRVRWRIVVPGKDGDATASFDLPANVAPPISVGASVQLDLRAKGGGPNRIGELIILDEHGGLLLAINALPEDWSADYGRALKTEKDDTYDEVTHAAKLGPAGKQAEVTGDWRVVPIAGARFFGIGWAVKRKLHRKLAPADYVAGWIDYALIRLP